MNALDVVLSQLLQSLKKECSSMEGTIFSTKLQNLFDFSDNANSENLLDFLKILKFLKSMLQYGSSTIYFNLTPYIVEFYLIFIGSSQIREDILVVLVCLTSKIADRKFAIYHNKIEALQNDVIKIIPSMKLMIKNFRRVSTYLINYSKNANHVEQDEQQMMMKVEDNVQNGRDLWKNEILIVIQQKIESAKMKESIEEKEFVVEQYRKLSLQAEEMNYSKQFFEEYLICSMKAINFYLNVGNLKKSRKLFGRNETNKLEKILPPAQTIEMFIQLLNCSHLNKKVHISVLNSFFLFAILDLNQLFDYSEPLSNKYYLETCKNPEFFIQLLQKFAKYHAYQKIAEFAKDSKFQNNLEEIAEQLDTYKNLQSSITDFEESQMQIDESAMIDEHHQTQQKDDFKNQSISSQKYLNSYLNLLCHLINIKNKQFQTQLHLQFVKPILAILSVKPINNIYPININCQVRAAKLLKDVVRHTSMDETSSVELIIKRVRFELMFMQQSELNLCQNKCNQTGYHEWEKPSDDDTENNMILIYKQDFIKSCLRFLCYTVFRNDPNAINFNQNFIANSRKILDSGLIQNEIMNYILLPNQEVENTLMHKMMDPILPQCLQLISYVFNDLPQKIPQYLENDLLPQVVRSLEIRVPLQPEIFILVMKFLYTISLNPKGADLVQESNVIETLMVLGTQSKAYLFLSNTVHKLINYQHQLQQLALINEGISVKTFKILLNNFKLVNKKAWDVTFNYIAMDRRIVQMNQSNEKTAEEIEVGKSMLKQAYEKEQTGLEYSYENITNLMFNYIYAEQEQFGEDNLIHRAVKQSQLSYDQLLEVIQTPIVASACPNMFKNFIYITSQIVNEYTQPKKQEFYQQILIFLRMQIINLQDLLNTNNFDTVKDINSNLESKQTLFLSEFERDNERLEALNQLRGEDQISVTFGKISFYCDLLKAGLLNYDKSVKLITFEDFIPVLEDLFKIQGCINRYHSAIYEREMSNQKQKYKSYCQMYPQIMEYIREKSAAAAAVNLIDHAELKKKFNDIMSEKELMQLVDLRLKFEQEVDSLSDQKARISQKTLIELTLEENISHTSNMCQGSIRRLIYHSLRAINKQRIHFSSGVQECNILLNQTIGRCIAEEFKEFTELIDPLIESNAGEEFEREQSSLQSSDNQEAEEEEAESKYEFKVMKICCQHSAVLGEFNKILFPSGLASGFLMFEFIENKGLLYMESLLKWIIQTIYHFEMKNKLKKKKTRVELCKHLQLLFSHVIDFYVQFIEGRYFTGNQFNHFLCAFKSQPSEKLKREDQQANKELQEEALDKMRKYMFSKYVDIIRFLFQELNEYKPVSKLAQNVFDFFDRFSELFFSSYIQIYVIMSHGFAECSLFKNKSWMIQNNNNTNNNSSANNNNNNLFNFGGLNQEERRIIGNNNASAGTQDATNQNESNQRREENLLFQRISSNESPEKKINSSVHSQESFTKETQQQQIKGLQLPLNLKTFDELIEVAKYTLPLLLGFTWENSNKEVKAAVLENLIFKFGLQGTSQQFNGFLEFYKQALYQQIKKSNECKDTVNTGYLARVFEALLRCNRGTILEKHLISKYLYLLYESFLLLIEEYSSLVSEKVDENKRVIANTAEQSTIPQEVKTKNEWMFNQRTNAVNFFLTLFMFIGDELKSSNDIKKVESILAVNVSNSIPEQLQAISKELKKIQEDYDQNKLFQDNEESNNGNLGQLLSMITYAILKLFKGLHQMKADYEHLFDFAVYRVLQNSISFLNIMMNLNHSIADFDCHQIFLKNEGIQSLFGIKFIAQQPTEFQFFNQNYRNFDKRWQNKMDCIMSLSKILLQQLCSNEQSQIKVYEGIIKSILFMNFQEKYKKEEGSDIKKVLITDDFKQQLKQQQQQQSNKKKRTLTPLKRSKSEERPNEIMESASKLQHQHQEGSKESHIVQQQQQNMISTLVQKSQQKTIKQLIQKANEFGDISLTEFIYFFNKIMAIEDLKSFLVACQNVCVIKSKKVQVNKEEIGKESKKGVGGRSKHQQQVSLILEQAQNKKGVGHYNKSKQDTIKENAKKSEGIQELKSMQVEETKQKEETKEQPEEKYEEKLFISLNYNALKELLNNQLFFEIPEQEIKRVGELQTGTAGGVVGGAVPANITTINTSSIINKHQPYKFQQEIIFSLLDQLILQVRPQITILSFCKQEDQQKQQNEQQQQQSIKTPTLPLQKFFFNILTILQLLTYLIGQSPNLVGSLLKHKDGKTFKFLIRNIYFLLTLSSKSKTPTSPEINSTQNNQNSTEVDFTFNDEQMSQFTTQIVTDFFKRVLFDNPHQNIHDRKLKSQARQIFIKQSLKNLCKISNKNEFPKWGELRLVINIGTVWLYSRILEEEQDINLSDVSNNNNKKNPLIQNTIKYRNLIRNNVAKQLLYECQQMIKSSQDSVLYHTRVNLIAQIERIQEEIAKSLLLSSSFKNTVEYCMSSVLYFFKPYENSKRLWGDKIMTISDGKQRNNSGNVINETNLGFIQQRDDQSAIDEVMDDDEEDSNNNSGGSESSSSSSEEEDDDDDLLGSDRVGGGSEQFGIGEIDDDEAYGSEEEGDEDEDEDADGDEEEEEDDGQEEGSQSEIGESQIEDSSRPLEETDQMIQLEQYELDDINDDLILINENNNNGGSNSRRRKNQLEERKQGNNSNENKKSQEEIGGQSGVDNEMIDTTSKQYQEQMKDVQDTAQQDDNQDDFEVNDGDYEIEEGDLADESENEEDDFEDQEEEEEEEDDEEEDEDESNHLEGSYGDEEGEQQFSYDVEDDGEGESGQSVEIFFGRDQLEAGSLQNENLRQGVGVIGQRRGGGRLGDIISLNNISFDMHRMNLGEYANQNDQSRDESQSIMTTQSRAVANPNINNNSNLNNEGLPQQQQQQQMQQQQQQQQQQFSQENMGGLRMRSDFFGMIQNCLSLFSSNNQLVDQRQQIQNLRSNLMKGIDMAKNSSARKMEDQQHQQYIQIYDPQLIVDRVMHINRQMSCTEDLMKLYVKEQQVNQSSLQQQQQNISSPQIMQQVSETGSKQSSSVIDQMSRVSQKPLVQESQIKQKSEQKQFQFSNLNPFEQPQPIQTSSLFTLATTSAQQQQQQQMAMNNNLSADLDPEFIEALGQEGIQEILQTESVRTNIIQNSSGQKQDITTIVEMIESCQNQDQRHDLLRGLSEEMVNQLPSSLYSEALILRRLQNYQRGSSVASSSSIAEEQKLDQQRQRIHDPVFQITRNIRIPFIVENNGSRFNHLRGRGTADRNNNNIQNALVNRNRFRSFDSQLNDMLEFSRNNNSNFPSFFNGNGSGNRYRYKFTSQQLQNEGGTHSSLALSKNELFNNVINYLKDEITEMQNQPFHDPFRNFLDLDKFIEQLLQDSYLYQSSHEYDPNTMSSLMMIMQSVNVGGVLTEIASFNKLHGIVSMCQFWYKQFINSIESQQCLDRVMKIIVRMPGVKYGSTVYLLKWSEDKIIDLEAIMSKSQKTSDDISNRKMLKKMLTESDNKAKDGGIPNIVKVCIMSIRHLEQISSQFMVSQPYQGDILKPVNESLYLSQIYEQIYEGRKTALKVSLFEQLLNNMIVLSRYLDKYADLILNDVTSPALNESFQYKLFYGALFGELTKIIGTILSNQKVKLQNNNNNNDNNNGTIKNESNVLINTSLLNNNAQALNEESNKLLLSKQIIQKLGDLLIFERDVEQNKNFTKFAKTIFNKISSYNNEQSKVVHLYFKEHLNKYLQEFINTLKQSCNSNNSHMNLQTIKKLSYSIILLLKILKQDNKRKIQSNIGGEENGTEDFNICDEVYYYMMMDTVSQLITEKCTSSSYSMNYTQSGNFDQNESIEQKQSQLQMKQFSSNNQTSATLSFIFKQDFRTIMKVLFAIIEYNLKFIFKEEQKQQQQQQQEPTSKSKKKSEQQKRAERKSQQIITTNLKKQQQQQQQQKQQQNLAQMQSSEEIKEDIIVNKGLSSKERGKLNLMEAIEEHLKNKIVDERIREDKRLKVFIKFCLQHKKVINSFIRANQEVLNDSLRNIVMQVPQMLDFDNKRLLFRSEIKKMKRKFRLHSMGLSVRREHIFEDSFDLTKTLSIDKWKGSLDIEFRDEQGIDEGGLTKEWFTLLSQSIFDPNYCLFIQSSTGAGSNYYPNMNSSYFGPNHLEYFRFTGKIVAKALYEQQLLDCYFVRALYKIMLGQKLSYHDVEEFDNELYKNLKWCLENDITGIGLTFSESQDNFGEQIEIELIPDGKNIEVTEENKFDYVQKKAFHKLYLSVKPQIDSFLKGFFEFIPKELVSIFDSKELELLISGLPNIDIMDLKENTEYSNYTSDSQVIRWLWDVLEEFDNSERAEFIQFVTGSSKIPVEGFKGLRGGRGPQKFQIVKIFSNDLNRLPQAHTCFKQLELPNYSSREMLKERLLTAIKEGKTFGFA